MKERNIYKTTTRYFYDKEYDITIYYFELIDGDYGQAWHYGKTKTLSKEELESLIHINFDEDYIK